MVLRSKLEEALCKWEPAHDANAPQWSNSAEAAKVETPGVVILVGGDRNFTVDLAQDLLAQPAFERRAEATPRNTLSHCALQAREACDCSRWRAHPSPRTHVLYDDDFGKRGQLAQDGAVELRSLAHYGTSLAEHEMSWRGGLVDHVDCLPEQLVVVEVRRHRQVDRV